MSATDYLAIRERLDHPRMVVFDLCAVSLASDDPEWPGWNSADTFPDRTALRWLCVACEDVLALFESRYPEDPRLRDGLERVLRWLGGRASRVGGVAVEWVASTMKERAAPLSTYYPDDKPDWRMRRKAHFAGFAIRGLVVRAAVASGADSPSWHRDESGCAGVLFSAAKAFGRRRETYLSRWWARCRALLPIADVTTAEIEWGDIELPPRPLADDLPGDGGDA